MERRETRSIPAISLRQQVLSTTQHPRSPRSTHAAPTQHPRSTHAALTQHPHNIHAASTQHPRSTHVARSTNATPTQYSRSSHASRHIHAASTQITQHQAASPSLSRRLSHKVTVTPARLLTSTLLTPPSTSSLFSGLRL